MSLTVESWKRRQLLRPREGRGTKAAQRPRDAGSV
jgi:hypothetical protein